MATAWSPTSSHPSGGGFTPVQAIYTGNNVATANGAFGSLTLDTKTSGTELLDRTDPANPSIITAGTYALSVSILGDALTAGGYAIGYLIPANQDGAAAFTTAPGKLWGGSVVFVAAAGDLVLTQVFNADGVSTRNFSVDSAILVRLA